MFVVTAEHVPEAFDRVARAYDLLSACNPGYVKHLAWSADRLGCAPTGRLLDLCCGTGLSTAALRRRYPRAEITGLDGSRAMLERARQKSGLSGVRWVRGDAMDPGRAGVCGLFDGVMMAYGIRNVPDPDVCLRRILELLKPGGRVCFHEYSVADSLRGKLVWNAVAGAVIIPLGTLATRAPALFRYLRQSVNAFDGVATFERRLRDAGFTEVYTQPMDGWQLGIVHSFLGKRPAR